MVKTTVRAEEREMGGGEESLVHDFSVNLSGPCCLLLAAVETEDVENAHSAKTTPAKTKVRRSRRRRGGGRRERLKQDGGEERWRCS